MRTIALAALLAFGAAGQQPIYTAKDPGVKAPSVIFEKKPVYTAEAMRMRIEGRVVLETVIGTDGRPTAIKVIKSLHPSLDGKAIAALELWRFMPAQKDGKAVAIRSEVEMTFALGDRRIYDKSSADITSAPVVVFEKRPAYTAEAMRQKIQGTVLVEGVVGEDGSVAGARVVKGIREDLDEKALSAFRQWRFKPARAGGRPVAYRVQCEITFTLR